MPATAEQIETVTPTPKGYGATSGFGDAAEITGPSSLRSDAANQSQERLVWTPHPMVDFVEGGKYRALSDLEIKHFLATGTKDWEIEQYWREREQRIQKSHDDPLAFGFEPPHWKDVRALIERKKEVYGLGGNGGAKTEIGGKAVDEKLCVLPGAKVLCVTLNDDYSKLQQAAVYKYLPSAIRKVNERAGPQRRETVKKIKYSQAGGFTEGTFVLPNRSQCWFKTVEQYLRSPTSFEGPEYDFIWIDEPVPVALLETLRYRAGKRNGKLLCTFTAVNGYDATCQSVLDGARLVKSLPMNWVWDLRTSPRPSPQSGEGETHSATRSADGYSDARVIIPELKLDEVQVKGCPAGHMPYMMQPLDPGKGVIFLWTHWNLFLPKSDSNPHVPAVFGPALRKSKQTVRMRLFGWAEKLVGCQFPNFNPNVHVVEHEKIQEMLVAKKFTSFHSNDPATARSYFLLWMGIDAMGRRFIFDESPRHEEGEWVSDDGEKGDGQRVYAGRGVNFYKGYIRVREQEHGVESVRKFGDPRAFATQAAANDGGHSLLELFANEDSNNPENEMTAPMYYEPAKVMRSLLAEAASGSLDKINDALSYETEKPVSAENEPHLYISDRCKNLIKCILHWDPAQGEKSPYKDPIDTLRYLFGEELFYIDPDMPEVIGGRGWGARR